MKLTKEPVPGDILCRDDASRAELTYRVVGLPAGQEAEISEFNGVWRIWRDPERGWHGEYVSADDALTALESQVAWE